MGFRLPCNVGKDAIVGKLVSGIEEDDIVAGCHPYALVHGIVESLVSLADDAYGASSAFLSISLSLCHGVVLRQSVDDKVLDVGVSLPPYALKGAPDVLARVISAGDDGECNHVSPLWYLCCKIT